MGALRRTAGAEKLTDLGRILNRAAGFTLIELVIVITISAIVAGMGAAFISRPIEGYVALNRRAALVDAADTALRRMQRDVRQALPNSVRIGCGGQCLEMLHVSGGGRYRNKGPGNVLDFTASDTGMDVLGTLSQAPSAGQSMVVYNLWAAGATSNAYGGDNRGVVGGGSTATSVVLNPAFKFPFSSPYQRFFIVDTPVTYFYDSGTKKLTRHSGYAIAAAQPETLGALSAGVLLADKVASCIFTYQAGAGKRSGLVLVAMSITESGETISLLEQIHVGNAP